MTTPNIELLKDIFHESNIFDYEEDSLGIEFTTPLDLSGGHDWGVDREMVLYKLIEFCREHDFIYSFSGTGDEDIANRIRIILSKK